ncbi:DUF4350 domain-containing protein [Amycolatopsis nigrescens]|uniref:DUF4350 domain-containing protein n=1 Tax=Amycolatopsis nigrescens TaxID=381445 RepID=UPI00068864A5|nr:DUF4350 domain-containing protein [Amycolatopsis nigrescens]
MSTGSVSVSPDARRIWRAARVPVAIVLLLVATAVATVLLSGERASGDLEPTSYEPNGAHALATLLAEQGVRVQTVRTMAEAEKATGERVTLLVTAPDLVEPGRLAGLRNRAGSAVLVEPSQRVLDGLLPGLRATSPVPVQARPPGCADPVAAAAGDAVLGGMRYQAPVTCYDGTLAKLGTDVTVLGSGAPLTNEQLAAQGTAALAMRLLGAQADLVWYLPSPSDPELSRAQRPLTELLPRGWIFGAIQLLVAVLVLALWRARRLGPVVAEPLPVVVRAAETTEGRARLYRRSGAVDHAAQVLRQATIDRLLPSLGLGAGAEPAAVVDAVAARTGHGHAATGELLYGPAPADQAALVRLADALDELENEVGRS